MTTQWINQSEEVDSDHVENLSSVPGSNVSDALNSLDGAIGGVLTDAAPVNVTTAAAAVGVSTEAARADHKHDITIDTDGVSNASSVVGVSTSDALETLATAIAERTLTETLAAGNSTGASDIIVSAGQTLRGAEDLELEPGAAPGDRIVLSGLRWPLDAPVATTFLMSDGMGTLAFLPVPADSLGDVLGVGAGTGGHDIIVDTTDVIRGAVNLVLAPGVNPTDHIVIDGLSWPTTDGNANDVLTTNGSGTLTFASIPSVGFGDLTGDTSDNGNLDAALSSKADLVGPAFSGNPTVPTATLGDNDFTIANTAFVTAAVGVESTARSNADALKANLASPTFTGTPAAPTAAPGTNTTQLATTAFVTAADTAAVLNRPLVYNSSGLVSSPKIWIGTASIGATGAWSASITSASFSAVTAVVATVLRNTSTVIQQPVTTLLTVGKSTITGQCWDGRTNIGTGDTVEVTTNGAPTTTVHLVVYGT